jgi:hypothetical protein
VKIPYVWSAAHYRLAVKFQNKAQHTVGSRMLRSHVDGKFFFLYSDEAEETKQGCTRCINNKSRQVVGFCIPITISG